MIEYENLKAVNHRFSKDLVKIAQETIDSGWYILGNRVEVFEKEFSNYLGAKHCIGVASGLDALFLSMKVLDLPKESEVLVPSNTYIATILSILQNNLVPVLVEPDASTFQIDPKEIQKKITSKTKAILPVHLYGAPCDMAAIGTIANDYGLYIIEDCAQAHGTVQRGKKVGTFGICNAFSFYPTKNLGALGDGGAIITDDDGIVEKIRFLRNYGSKIKYQNETIGYNSRLDEIQAGFLSLKLKYLDEMIEHKKNLAQIYFDNVKNPFVKLPLSHRGHSTYHIFPILVERRDEFRKFLLDNGIKTEIHYPIPPSKQKAIKELESQGKIKLESYPISEKIHSEEVSLPISFSHSVEEIQLVCKVINQFQ